MASLAVSAALLAAPALATDPGQIDHAELATSSRFQGIGGPVTVTAQVFVASDPHRTMIVSDLRVELLFGAGFTLVAGENPAVVGSLQVAPTVSLNVTSYTWTLTAKEVGDHTLQVNVTSASSGFAGAQANITVREGVVLGRTILEPLRPTTDDILVFTVPAASGFDDPNVTLNVTLFVFERPGSVKPVSATGSRLRLSTGETVLGSGFPMAGGNGTYSYSIPPQRRGTLIWWVFAETPYSNVTSAPTRVFIEDPGTTLAVQWGGLGAVAALLGVSLYVVFYDPFGRRRAAGSIHNSPDRVPPALLLLAIGVALVAVSTALGATEGLWRWFGYL